MTAAVRPPQHRPRRTRKTAKQRLEEVPPPRSAHDLARAMFIQADQRRAQSGS